MSAAVRAWARVLGGAAILGVLGWRLGAGPFLDGIRRIDGWSLAAAAGIAVVTTVCSAWRWSLVADGLGLRVRLGPAVAAYYRSQFLNTVLPGGVVGDVHRGVSQGRDAGDVGRGLRAVGWERTAGQVVQLGLAALVLLILPSPARSRMPVIVALVALVVIAAVLAARRRSHHLPIRWARGVLVAVADVRHGLLADRAWPGIVLASIVVVVGHAATFLLAARIAGATASTLRLLPLVLLVLLAMGMPTNIGGWGPREGMAAWAFAAAGLTGAQGLAAAAVYGVMVFVAVLPGAAVVLATWIRRDRRPAVERTFTGQSPVLPVLEGSPRG